MTQVLQAELALLLASETDYSKDNPSVPEVMGTGTQALSSQCTALIESLTQK